jgi:putative addiction module component (TIGR02574 family)
MPGKPSIADLLALAPDERLQLVEDLWDSLAEIPEAVTLTEAQRHELDARLAAFHQNPQLGSPWADVKKRILDGL